MTSTATYTNTDLIRMLHRAGVRPSAQRLAVLDYIANLQTHPAADEVFVYVSKDFPAMSRTTVYNSLHALVEAGVLRQLEMDGPSTRYDLALLRPHSHFRCKCCGKIFDMGLPAGLERVVAEGFEVDAADLFFAGRCPECLKKEFTEK